MQFDRNPNAGRPHPWGETDLFQFAFGSEDLTTQWERFRGQGAGASREVEQELVDRCVKQLIWHIGQMNYLLDAAERGKAHFEEQYLAKAAELERRNLAD